MSRPAWRKRAKRALQALGVLPEPLPTLHRPDEAELRAAVAVVQPYTMCGYLRLASLWAQVRYLDRRGVAGALVECGTCQGGAAALMALAHRAGGEASRPLHLFDSFEGLPEPDAARDGAAAVEFAGGAARAGGQLASIGRDVGSLEVCRRAVGQVAGYPEEQTHYHVGWFQDTVAPAAEAVGPIALLRLDGDWYESTRLCLEALCGRVVAGGFVVIDDYGHWEGCRRAVDEYLAARSDTAVYLHYVDPTARYWVVEP